MRAATIVVRPMPQGFVCCTAGSLGDRLFGQPGQMLDTLALAFLARQAGEQGGRLLIEVQADGKASFPCELPSNWSVIDVPGGAA